MKDKLLIIGAGGHGKVVADIAKQMNRWRSISFLDDKELTGQIGLEVIGTTNEMDKFVDNHEFVVAIGNNEKRRTYIHRLEKLGASLPIIKHPSAIISDQVKIGYGTVIMPGVIINCCAEIGKGCIINTGAIVEHDCVIGDFVHLSPGSKLGGGVIIKSGSWLGMGCVVKNQITIIDDCIIGAGAVMLD
jgi:sugar O-acyltransferase (sialic acid O-acetyltransferase NeuD family)